jgi:hypothetical protein
VGVDISEVFLRDAAAASDHIGFIHADAAVLPLRTESVDFVTAFMSLMDVADPEPRCMRPAESFNPADSCSSPSSTQRVPHQRDSGCTMITAIELRSQSATTSTRAR